MIAKLEIQKVELIGPFTSQSNKQYRKQVGYLHLANEPYPIRVLRYVGKEEDVLQPGIYEVKPKAYVDRFSGIAFSSEFVLIKQKQVATA